MSTEKFIRIKGDVVEYIRQEVTKSCTTDDFLYQCSALAKISTGFLPRNCVNVIRDGNLILYVMELTPRCVKARYTDSSKVHDLMLSLPFVQFYQILDRESLGKVYLSCTKKRLTSEKDEIFILPALNQYGKGSKAVCTGNISFPINMQLTERIERFINAFFNAGFNNDLSMDFPSGLDFYEKDVKYGGMIGWSKHSEKNPMFGLSKDVEYLPHRQKTFEKLVQYILDRHKGLIDG